MPDTTLDDPAARGSDATLRTLLRAIYGDEKGDAALAELAPKLDAFRAQHPRAPVAPADRLGREDAVLIAYGDHVKAEGEAPLATLGRVLRGPLADTVTGVHVLPFYPWTSDDGFAVSDYTSVDPELGSWSDVRGLGATHRLMFDAVINHTSSEHPWFGAWLADDPRYAGHFRAVDPSTDLSDVVRPRTTPLLTPFEATDGTTRHVWTTFSADQVDLDYRDPRVLLDVMDVLLRYVEEGATILRLDAVTFLWKEIGHPSAHHPNTHRVLQAIRAAFERAAPGVVMLTETNVPHAENVGYFGDGRNEAQMVYNFALPPLVLHGFLSGSARYLTEWARELSAPSDETTFFNFLASHDGVGVRAVETLLPRDEVATLGAAAEARGGYVSYKSNSDGSTSPYELNINYWDALNGDPTSDAPLDLQVRRFLTAHAIMLALPGVPGIYAHSLLGSRGDRAGAEASGRPRTINRERLDWDTLTAELDDPEHRRRKVRDGFRRLLSARRSHAGFDPMAPMRVLDAPEGVFAIERTAADGGRIVAVHNVGAALVDVAGFAPRGADPLAAVGPGAVDGELAQYATIWWQG